MKIKIIANNSIYDKEYYDKFIGKTFDVIYYEKIYGVCELLIPSPQGDKTTYWYHGEVEIIEQ